MYGSDRGMMLVPPLFGVIDVLTFSGGEVAEVADARVGVRDLAAVDTAGPITAAGPIIAELVVEPVDDTGAVVTRNDRCTAVQIRNDNESAVDVRLVYIVWDEPPPGRTHQAL